MPWTRLRARSCSDNRPFEGPPRFAGRSGAALFSGDAAGAHQTLRTLLQTGQTRIALLALITRQLRMLTHLAFARENGASLDAVEKEMKIHPYAARKMRGQIRRLSARALEEAYLSCVEADFAVKSGKLRDAAALERILLKISDFGRN